MDRLIDPIRRALESKDIDALAELYAEQAVLEELSHLLGLEEAIDLIGHDIGQDHRVRVEVAGDQRAVSLVHQIALAAGLGCQVQKQEQSCDDGDLCTHGDMCKQGICTPGWAVSCTQQSCMETAECDRNTGLCSGDFKKDGAVCSLVEAADGWCDSGQCFPQTCSNGQQDKNEYDVDCGGVCRPCEVPLERPTNPLP